MKKKYYNSILILVTLLTSCNVNDNVSTINTSHLDYLYKEININNQNMAIVNIYSDYPTYDFVGDEDEGISCVDDVARAAVFYHNDFKITKNKASLDKNRKLIDFILYMQSDNGYFYNFIWPDYSINRTHQNSEAIASWWSWRALWALTESYYSYKEVDSVYAGKMNNSILLIINEIIKNNSKDRKYEKIDGRDYPIWLPYKYASDQSAILLLALINYYNISPSKDILTHMTLLADGISEMQINDTNHEYYGALLSWKNTWHSWGNSQSYALLKYYNLTKKEKYLITALKELDNFYPHLYKINFLDSFIYNKGNTTSKKYSQIAYGIRPIVFSLLEGYKITNDIKYANLAGNIAKWFNGNNIANTNMYDPNSGIIYDGINEDNVVNKNSGAESTIEGLLTIQAINSIDISRIIYNSK